ncbi:hypothetical protein [Streptomyces sp. NPDC058694]|uniref:hypothetical protein n=1 Tax=Streptomyces sp. NPDC058694 TaxID=3346603 RepID=UPI0036695A47
MTVFSPFEPVVGHLAFDDMGLAAQASGGQEPFQQVFLEYSQCLDQEVRGGSCILSVVGVCLVVGVVGLAFSGNDDTNASGCATSEAPLAVEEEPATDPDEALDDLQEQNGVGQDELDAEIEEEAAKDGEYSEGAHLVGEDMRPGTYTTAGAKSGIFEFCSITTEPTRCRSGRGPSA